jgi:hypothetical protein
VRAPNVLSFDPRAGPHGGRHWVPATTDGGGGSEDDDGPSSSRGTRGAPYSEFLDAYAAWWEQEQERIELEQQAEGRDDGATTNSNAPDDNNNDNDNEGPAVARPLTLAEAYGVEPYRYFQEFDLSWNLDPALVLRLVDALCEVVAEEAAAAFGADGGVAGLTTTAPDATSTPSSPPRYVVAMRTPYKVHLNFPAIVTNEARARVVRLRVAERMRAALGGALDEKARLEAPQLPQQPPYPPPPAALQRLAEELAEEGAGTNSSTTTAARRRQRWRAQLAALDWAGVVDAPHGSLRLPGSRKSAAQEGGRDPAWVSPPRDKYYLPVEKVAGWVEEEEEAESDEAAPPPPPPSRSALYGPWRRLRLTRVRLADCSIRPTPKQLARYESSPGYLEGLYLDAEHRRAVRGAAKARKRERERARRESEERAAREAEERAMREREAERRYKEALAEIGGGGGNVGAAAAAGVAAAGASASPSPTPPLLQRPSRPSSPAALSPSPPATGPDDTQPPPQQKKRSSNNKRRSSTN